MFAAGAHQQANSAAFVTAAGETAAGLRLTECLPLLAIADAIRGHRRVGHMPTSCLQQMMLRSSRQQDVPSAVPPLFSAASTESSSSSSSSVISADISGRMGSGELRIRKSQCIIGRRFVALRGLYAADTTAATASSTGLCMHETTSTATPDTAVVAQDTL